MRLSVIISQYFARMCRLWRDFSGSVALEFVSEYLDILKLIKNSEIKVWTLFTADQEVQD